MQTWQFFILHRIILPLSTFLAFYIARLSGIITKRRHANLGYFSPSLICYTPMSSALCTCLTKRFTPNPFLCMTSFMNAPSVDKISVWRNTNQAQVDSFLCILQEDDLIESDPWEKSDDLKRLKIFQWRQLTRWEKIENKPGFGVNMW